MFCCVSMKVDEQKNKRAHDERKHHLTLTFLAFPDLSIHLQTLKPQIKLVESVMLW